MFDLFRSRDKAVRYLLSGLLGLVALSMVITLIPGWGSQTSAPETVLAEVNGEPITVREMQTNLQMMVKNRNFPAEMVEMYIPQLIDQMVAERAVAYQAERMGFKVTDKELADAIRSMLTQVFPNGQFDRAIYQRFLADQGLTIDQFEANVRKNLMLLKLQNLALEGVVVTPAEIEKEFRERYEKIKLEYVGFKSEQVRNAIKLTPEEVKQYFNDNRANFRTDEKRSFDILIADEAKIAAGMQVPEADLRRAYDQNRDQFRTPDRVRARHILIKTMEKPKEEVPKLEAKANDLLRQIKAGADFAELAKKNSEDTGSAVKGGDLDWVSRGQTVKPFEDAAFSLAPKQTSGVIKTEYGFHIIQVLEKEEARLKPFEEVKAQLVADVQRQAVQDKMQNSVDQARAALSKAPQDAANIAKQFGLVHLNVANHGPNESIPEIGSSREVDATIAVMKPGDVSPVFQIGTNKLAVATVTGIQPVRQAELHEVESKVREQLLGMRAQQYLTTKMKEASDKFTETRGDLKAVAAIVGNPVKTSDAVDRNASIEGIGPASYFREAFDKPVGSAIGPVNLGAEVYFAKVAEKVPADMSKLEAERPAILLSLKRKKANERKELFEDGVLAQLLKEGKVKKYPETIKRVTSSYRNS